MEPNGKLKIYRYPNTTDNSLKAWNAADELIIDYLKSTELNGKRFIIYHDRFGYLSYHLYNRNPQIVINYKSQEKSIIRNLKANDFSKSQLRFLNPLDKPDSLIDTALIKIPKSLDLFELYLNHLIPSLSEHSRVVCGFMTRHFSKQALEIAHKYFEEVEQTKAKKKARLILLKTPKNFEKVSLIHKIALDEGKYLRQFYGVFSASKIDIATQFFLNNMNIKPEHKNILDLGCGNGILAYQARQLNPSAQIYLTDDHFLAIESAKINLGSSPFNHFHFTDDLSHFENEVFDLIISNPPFHFEHENNIEITLSLFEETHRILKPKGEFQLVANIHLNYKTHLSKTFASVETIAQNNKFIVYRCLR